MSTEKAILSFLYSNKGKISGIICGLLFGIIILTLGFLKGLFLTMCIILGCWIGSFYDKKESFLSFLEKILSNGLPK